jgi:hypothetical protein
MLTKLEILNHHESPYDIGKKQWYLLDSLKSMYENSDMSAFIQDGKFLDPIWYPIDSIYVEINFNHYFPDKNQYPLALFCRVVCYELIAVHGYAASTVFSRLSNFRNIVNSSEWGGIMFAERNQSFPMLSSLEPEVITNFAQNHLVQSSAISSGAFKFLNMISTFKGLNITDVFVTGMILPWHEQEIGVENWVDQQREVAGVIKQQGFFAPMPFEHVSNIVKHSLPIVEDHREDLISFFKDFNNILSKFNGPSALKNYKKSKKCKDLVEKYMDTFSLILPVKYANIVTKGNYIPIQAQWLTDILKLVKSACSWIIELTTGLRNIDMRDLRIGCCRPSKRFKGMWWLVADVKKTKNRIVIPVGKPTYKAVKLLESARYFSDSDFLITSSVNSESSSYSGRKYSNNELGRIRTPQSFNKLLKFISQTYNFSIATIAEDDADATSHCVRATLAGYIGESTNAAILILKRLFGHSNALMPNEYLYRNPLIIKKRNELQLKLTDSMAKDMAYAVTYGEVSGRNGERLLKGAEHIKAEIKQEFRLKNRSLTEMELFQTLEERLTQIYLDDMKNGETYALLTPLAVVCNRACNNTSDSPCAAQSNNQDRISSGVKKAITDALSTLPNPAQCVGVSCPDALLGKKWSRQLLENFDCYYKYRNVIDPKSTIEEDAKVFVSMYAGSLMAIYGDEREEGYFNVVK